MTFETKRSIGDKIIVEGREYIIREYIIKSMHVYLSDEVQTERYYLGENQWLTVHIKGGIVRGDDNASNCIKR